MLTLGISTSSGQFALVLGEDNKLIFDSDDFQLSEKKDISILISTCLEFTKISVSSISNIIADIGPGGTSRVRTGIAFANSLAYSLGIAVCPVSSLELAGIEAWDNYARPVISTVKSINGNAYCGFFNNNKLISIEYGTINNLIPHLANGLEEIVVVGYHRELIKSLLPTKKIIDSGALYGNAKILVEKSYLFLDRAIFFPKFAIPINEKTIQR